MASDQFAAVADVAWLDALCQEKNAADVGPLFPMEEPGSPSASEGESPVDRGESCTDAGNALRLVAAHGRDLRYIPERGDFVVWDGRRYRVDDTMEVVRRAKATARSIYAMAAASADATRRQELARHAARSESAPRISAMIDLARSESDIVARWEQFDADPMLFNVLNGTLELETGRLRQHRREDLQTKCAPVVFDPAARAPRFSAFLDEIFAGNARLILFLQLAVGYCLTGRTSEQVFFLCYGVGANGKSVLLDVLRALLGLGEYAISADFSTFLERKGDGPRSDLVRLAGARVVTAAESGEGRRLAEGTVKSITGGDPQTARALYASEVTFTPTFKVWLASNSRPVIRDTGESMRRRYREIPFATVIPEDQRDPHLAETLRGELPGILNWALEGCLRWQREGLGTPPEVRAASEAYLSESDLLGTFLRECCNATPGGATLAKELYDRFKIWIAENGERHMTQTAFGRALGERGFPAERRGRGREDKTWRVGLTVRDPATPPESRTVVDSSFRDFQDFRQFTSRGRRPNNSPQLPTTVRSIRVPAGATWSSARRGCTASAAVKHREPRDDVPHSPSWAAPPHTGPQRADSPPPPRCAVTLAELRAKYEAMAGEFARYGALVDGAKLCRAVAADTAAVECAAGAEILTLAQARAVSGYSDRALREMIATGKLENVGRKHAPRVRAGDLPRKAAPAAPRPATGYSADADALRLMTRGGRGAA